MIGTNSTMSFKTPVGWWAKLTAPLWRRQEHHLFMQVASGVRYYDLRITYRKPGMFIRHQYYCHGSHRFVLEGDDEQNFLDVLTLLQNAGAIVSITLENSNAEDRHIFRSLQWHEIFKGSVLLTRIRTGKHTYDDVFRSTDMPEIIDRTYHWSVKRPFLTPKAWANKNNIITREEFLNNKIYLYDYYNLIQEV